MTSDATETTKRTGLGWGALLRFLPYLWPKDEPKLRTRVVAALVLVLAAKAATLTMPFAYKAIVDRMSAGMDAAAGLVIALVIAYAGARFGSVLFDNLQCHFRARRPECGAPPRRNRVPAHPRGRCASISSRTGSLTKIVERGIKSTT